MTKLTKELLHNPDVPHLGRNLKERISVYIRDAPKPMFIMLMH